jgi:hypothetical protein
MHTILRNVIREETAKGLAKVANSSSDGSVASDDSKEEMEDGEEEDEDEMLVL